MRLVRVRRRRGLESFPDSPVEADRPSGAVHGAEADHPTGSHPPRARSEMHSDEVAVPPAIIAPLSRSAGPVSPQDRPQIQLRNLISKRSFRPRRRVSLASSFEGVRERPPWRLLDRRPPAGRIKLVGPR